LEQVQDPIVPRLLTLLTEQQRREKERKEAHAVARHRLGNAISIAQANVEALADGVLEPTRERLYAIRDALQSSGAMLDELRIEHRNGSQPPSGMQRLDVRALLMREIGMLAPVAQAKNVEISCAPVAEHSDEFHGDAHAVAQAIRHVLLSAVRYTPPGGTIHVSWGNDAGELLLTVSGEGFSVLSKLVEAVGSQAYAVNESQSSATMGVSLAVAPA
jgi:two-component system phosphate regulon sensor histidine kinase PhoR